jgi:NAD(P)H-dependent flavin oxidoreductase YrpB (nitropropane dioxygenase family)
MPTPLCHRLGLTKPIFAFSRTPAVVAAVSRAGGLGVLGAVAYDTDQLKEHLDWIADNTGGRPWGVDVVMPASHAGADGAAVTESDFAAMIPARTKAFVADLLQQHGIPELPKDEGAWHSLLAWTEEQTRPQVELAISYDIALLANALGPPPQDIVASAHDKGILVAALTGSVRHAQKQIATGVDIIVAQGTEAGGHCGEVSTMVLVPEVVDSVAPAPVLAAGGIGDGRQIAAALALGAQGAWMGSIWLTVNEAVEDTGRALTRRLLAATSRDTVRSKAISGKPARQLRTAWTEAFDSTDGPGTLPLPLQWMSTAEATSRIHRHAAEHPDADHPLLMSPVGQIVGRMNEVRPVAVVMDDLERQYTETIRRLDAI